MQVRFHYDDDERSPCTALSSDADADADATTFVDVAKAVTILPREEDHSRFRDHAFEPREVESFFFVLNHK